MQVHAADDRSRDKRESQSSDYEVSKSEGAARKDWRRTASELDFFLNTSRPPVDSVRVRAAVLPVFAAYSGVVGAQGAGN